MIKFTFTNKEPIENDDYWSYPFDELDHIFENAEDGDTYLYYDGRLYEAPYLDEDDDFIIIEKEKRMKTYKIIYTESLVHTFYVNALNKESAREEFNRKSANGELDYSGGEVYDTSVESIEEVK